MGCSDGEVSSGGEQVVVRSEFLEDLLQMVNNPNVSDIVFVCEDGIQVHASRMLLAARSLFFSRMLLNGMAESRETSFALPTVTSSVLLIVLKFLYADVLLDKDIQDKTLNPTSDEGVVDMASEEKCPHLNLDWKLLLKVIVGARFLMLDHLEKTAMGKLWEDLPGKYHQKEIVLKRVAYALSALCDNPALWNENKVKQHVYISRLGTVQAKPIEFICFLLIKMLASNELSTVTLRKLSKEAFHLYLAKTRNTSNDEDWEWTTAEYMKLREVFTWCAVRTTNSGTEFEDVGRYCLPGLGTTLSFLQRSVACAPTEDDPDFDFTQGREAFVRKIIKEDLRPLLPMVDLPSIHPELLMSVVEPLTLIDTEDLSLVYRAQAGRASRRLRKVAVKQVVGADIA